MNKKKNFEPSYQNSLLEELAFTENINPQWVSCGYYEVDKTWYLQARELDDLFLFLPIEGQVQASSGDDSFILRSGSLWWVDENRTHWASLSRNHHSMKVLAFHLHLNHRLGGRFRLRPSSGVFQLPEEWIKRLKRVMVFSQEKGDMTSPFLVHEAKSLILELFTQEKISLESPDEIDPRVREILHWLEEQKDWIPSLRDCAQTIGISSVHLRNLFQQHLSQNPHDYILRQRLSWAKNQILETSISVARVARGLGFASPQQFHRSFKKIYGKTPAELRTEEKNMI